MHGHPFPQRLTTTLCVALSLTLLLTFSSWADTVTTDSQEGTLEKTNAAAFNKATSFQVSLGRNLHPPVPSGAIIRQIHIEVRDIFEQVDNLVYRKANELKISTQKAAVRKELYFSEGESFEYNNLQETLRNLRSIRFLRDPHVYYWVDGKSVDVLVSVQDVWTFLPQFSYSSGDGRDRRSIGLTESNLLGWGKRAEILYDEEDGRRGLQAVYDSRRVLGTPADFLVGYFDRNDGEEYLLSIDRPLRTFVDKNSWQIDFARANVIGRLFEGGDESYIYRTKRENLGARYTMSEGNPEDHLYRYTFGYQYQKDLFDQAGASDYDDLALNPNEVSNDPALLADDRRFSGPTVGFQSIDSDFISRDYVDRFARVQDYNLGDTYSLNLFLSPNALGSEDDAMLISANYSRGWRLSDLGFLRTELGYSSRATEDGMENSLYRLEIHAYEFFGRQRWLGMDLGTHTFASAFNLQYGEDLDNDRQLLLGAENGLRGYKSRTFPGDKRFTFNVEDRMHLIENIYDLISIGSAVFLDMGGATYGTIEDLFSKDLYANVGTGLRIGFPKSSGERILRIEVALPLREGLDDSDRFEPRFIFAGGQPFSSRLSTERVGAERASVDIGFDR